MNRAPRELWRPHLAGVLLGLGLLLTFVLTGHGLGASGFPTAVAAAGAHAVAPATTARNDYLGGMVAGGRNPLSAWITWEVIGLAIGALGSALCARRFRWRIDGPELLRRPGRMVLALIGGILSGFGARVALGCTSGLGLSGSATLAVAGFLFLVGFFVVGAGFGLLLKRYWA